ncbi:melatonin receptor type 1C-like [Protopterus annectens]|uniref:melatonin receptor type 1C-like n=1 Tax=Protopterus annectens TaxID=7888 RepID=UPI001CFA84AD|nr:melatonin receptor type 1C-like [Protopterus annectens]
MKVMIRQNKKEMEALYKQIETINKVIISDLMFTEAEEKVKYSNIRQKLGEDVIFCGSYVLYEEKGRVKDKSQILEGMNNFQITSNVNVSCNDSTFPSPDTFPTYETSTGLTIFFASFMIFITVMDILGNVLVILSVVQNKKLLNAGNLFVISLSIADLMVALHPYPLLITAILQNRWTMGELQCKIFVTIQGLNSVSSVYNIMAIAINRYCCICHSTIYGKVYTMKKTCGYILLTWIVSLILLSPVTFVGAFHYHPPVYSCVFIFTVNAVLTISVAIFHFIIPLTVVIYCYLRIWVLVIQVKYRVKKDMNQKLAPAEVQNFLTMFAVFVLFAVCWGPMSIPALIVSLSPPGKVPKFPDSLFVVGFFTASFNSCLNGIVYGIFNKNFRQEYKHILLLLYSYTMEKMKTKKQS